jgi:hypothetical protein
VSIFKYIDDKLHRFAEKINGTLVKDRSSSPITLTFEERRIDWREGDIRKAIIIQPNFEITGVNSSIWNFINIAWIEKNGLAVKPGWVKELVNKEDFQNIEERIDELLSQSEKNLSGITIDDLK